MSVASCNRQRRFDNQLGRRAASLGPNKALREMHSHCSGQHGLREILACAPLCSSPRVICNSTPTLKIAMHTHGVANVIAWAYLVCLTTRMYAHHLHKDLKPHSGQCGYRTCLGQPFRQDWTDSAEAQLGRAAGSGRSPPFHKLRRCNSWAWLG